jgi:glycosyltransferase involved in cell wall biosynthesis
MKIVVVIPAYNEEETLGMVIDRIRLLPLPVEIIVVDDGSTDSTFFVAHSKNVTLIEHPKNKGLGASTRTGLRRAYEMGCDIAVKIDADMQHNPEDIIKVITPILNDYSDVVIGSRFMGGLKYKMPLYRHLGNKFFSWLVSKLIGQKITDGQTGLMAFHRRYLKEFNMFSDYNETQQLIIDAWRKHYRIMEIPVEFHKRETGKSFISFRYPFKVIPTLVRLFMQSDPLKFFVVVGVATSACGVFYKMDAVMMTGILIVMFGFLLDSIGNK